MENSMCLETHGVPPMLTKEERGPSDRIDPRELTPLGPVSWGYVARAEGSGSGTAQPILIQCHERYGVVQHTIELADRFAEAGFVTIAPDFYADVELTGAEERLPEISDEAALRHIDAAIAYARTLEGCGEDSPVAVIGVCRTGSYGLVADAERDDIDAVVLLYGGAQDREYEVGDLRTRPYEELIRAGDAPVLGLWGEKDHTMSVDDVRRVRDLLENAGRSYEFVLYPDLPHGWLNDTMPGRFREEEANESFDRIARWLGERLSGPESEHVTWSFTSRYAHDYDFANNPRLH
jgi:carboxymethylenebutenolidase